MTKLLWCEGLVSWLSPHLLLSVSSGHHHEEGFQELHHSGPAAVWPHVVAHSNAGDLPDLRGASAPQHPHTVQVGAQRPADLSQLMGCSTRQIRNPLILDSSIFFRNVKVQTLIHYLYSLDKLATDEIKCSTFRLLVRIYSSFLCQLKTSVHHSGVGPQWCWSTDKSHSPDFFHFAAFLFLFTLFLSFNFFFLWSQYLLTRLFALLSH